jgi:GTPase SAR1 family protein
MVIDQQRKEIDEANVLQIWDTLGQEMYRSMNRIYFKDATACCLVVDVTQTDPCRTLDTWWFEYTNQHNLNFSKT